MPSELQSDFNDVVNENGIPCRFVNYDTTTFTTTDYDDAQLASASGTAVSGGGIIQPIGASDKQFVERGLVNWNDSKLYFAGSIATNPNMLVTVGNTGSLYFVLPEGIKKWDVSGTTIYQMAFVRRLESGQHPNVI